MADLAEMELFLNAGALGSLTKAAIKLDLTQSAASRRLAALEERFGGRLFYRTGRGVRLTELGLAMLPRVKQLLGDLERVAIEARDMAGKPAGTVTLGVLPSVSRPLVSRLYREARARCPAVQLQINEAFGGLLDEAVANGTVDLAILNRYGAAPPEGEELLARVDMCLLGARGDRRTAKPTIPFRQLDGLPMLLPSAPNTWRGILERLARRHEISLNEAMAVDSVPVLLDVVKDGGCYAILPEYAVRSEATAGRLQASRIVKPSISRMLTLSITSQRPMTLATREIARLVRRLLPGIVGAA
jgi:LysR family nitrogen assimilation transcriptional regulator